MTVPNKGNKSKASYTRAHRMMCELLTNGSQAKCVYVWTGLRTCAAASANGSHTVRCEPKFVGFWCEHKENWMRLHALGILCSPQIHIKLINLALLTHHMRMAQHVNDMLVYTKLNNEHTECRPVTWLLDLPLGNESTLSSNHLGMYLHILPRICKNVESVSLKF